jgi:hypothetical protein
MDTTALEPSATASGETSTPGPRQLSSTNKWSMYAIIHKTATQATIVTEHTIAVQRIRRWVVSDLTWSSQGALVAQVAAALYDGLRSKQMLFPTPTVIIATIE